jgi:hypothetical protein
MLVLLAQSVGSRVSCDRRGQGGYHQEADRCLGHRDMFATELQLVHTVSMAHSDTETADATNQAMRQAGFIVPETFEDLPVVPKEMYEKLVSSGVVKVNPESFPMDYKWAQGLGLIGSLLHFYRRFRMSTDRADFGGFQGGYRDWGCC